MLKWLGFVVLVLATLLFLFVAFENYRGNRPGWLQDRMGGQGRSGLT